LELRVQVVVDKIEESFEIDIAGMLSKWFTGFVEAG
jgi:hypothetical protein